MTEWFSVLIKLLTSIQGYNGSQTSSRYSSRHSSIEPSYASSSAFGNDPRELKRLLAQLEEKYREVLVINAQLDCEKQFLTWVNFCIHVRTRIMVRISYLFSLTLRLLRVIYWYHLLKMHFLGSQGNYIFLRSGRRMDHIIEFVTIVANWYVFTFHVLALATFSNRLIIPSCNFMIITCSFYQGIYFCVHQQADGLNSVAKQYFLV